eukprot:TRINITY_DN4714_c0_g1_i2.p4 TRINITY_DN4714_c0_g1~~TRINITY_DN4714_c0_g1_i2.p4  ORF type:complete len:205 (-),score=47.96 TRINITY_DN4714_c0_g1_i2:49-663(-)
MRYALDPDQTLLSAIREGFLHEDAKARHPAVSHRLALFDKRGAITNIVSQSDVVKYLSGHTDKLGELRTKTVGELTGTSHPICIRQEKPAVEAFELMDKHRVSGVGVIDHEGVLVSAISSSDLRGITAADLSKLLLPVERFLARTPGNAAFHQMQPPITCTADETLATIVKRLAHHKAHRIFVVDHAGKPVGVVSLSDILVELA